VNDYGNKHRLHQRLKVGRVAPRAPLLLTAEFGHRKKGGQPFTPGIGSNHEQGCATKLAAEFLLGHDKDFPVGRFMALVRRLWDEGHEGLGRCR